MFTPELNKVFPSHLTQALADNARWRLSFKRDQIIESLSQPGQRICFVPVDHSVFTTNEQEQSRVDLFLEIRKFWTYGTRCVNCGDPLPVETDWCDYCNPITGQSWYEPIYHQGEYKAQFNYNISDTHAEEIDVFDETTPNLFKFK
jgi:hypothetical protein